MQTYKNTKYITRNYDCTNIVAAVAAQRPNENYQMCDDSILEKLTELYTENGTKYYGYL